ncbi:hypothetical protein DCO58_07670 [Helicobacter saguini]|uniref:Outer membrane beta-barrel protein n=1 Tax=Helicobacter saguini TaxID=1548018 RepID=A0A347VNF4_9HELI|nr:hypothetical protein [Helicobacter saguini]MWV61790.1 hypothetical protein [Helicobacter saguini]MWV67535.1 hypothetical protein [Helicobacter saguini]MWV69887.1 hypothetical protein [Helicobacter saguini]MWV72896.1 hypothetical protein [Helicobacter saguini]TLD93250.1 hypothetical protein LS64_009045 [Helicobacter saguini]
MFIKGFSKIILSFVVVGFFSNATAANGNGFFLGLDVGGAIGGLSNSNFNVTTNIDPNLPPKDTLQINAGFGLNVRIGGQGYFNEKNGMRGYLSVGGVFGAPSYAFGDLKATGITAVADFNVDYLHDFVVSETLRFGLYFGVSSGYLMTFYPGGSALIIADRDIPRFRGITAGLNFGFRAVVSNHNQFEFSTKSVITNSVATENIFGFQVFIGANYSYIF